MYFYQTPQSKKLEAKANRLLREHKPRKKTRRGKKKSPARIKRAQKRKQEHIIEKRTRRQLYEHNQRAEFLIHSDV